MFKDAEREKIREMLNKERRAGISDFITKVLEPSAIISSCMLTIKRKEYDEIRKKYVGDE